MSWKRGQKAGRGKKSSWSGGSVSQEAPRHRWQDATSSSDVNRTRRRRSRNRWAVTTVMALALLSFLVLLPLQWKPKTPFVVVAATKYVVPVPINAWAMEDREALEALNRKNLSLPDHMPDWNAGDNRFELLPKSLDLSKYRKVAPLVVYLSVHGVVKEDGEPCVLPPGVSIDDPKRWISVAELLDEISKKVPSTRDTLLVLDCNRIRTNWSLGIVYNTFAERVRELIDRKKIRGLAVLTSAGPGQVNWTSANFGGSVFARYLQLGLAGAADVKVAGDNDGDVTLQELASYLQHEVSAWSQSNRGERQEPMVIPRDANFHVTYALSGRAQRALAEQFETPESQGSHESTVKDEGLWSKLDELRKLGLVRCDPIACRDFEHQLLRLEELSHGGKEYAEEAKKLRAEVAERLSKATERAHTITAGSRSAAGYYGMTGDASWMRINDAGFSLPACEYFGLCDAKQSDQVRAMWKRLIDTHAPGTADSIVDGSGLTKVAQNLAETQLFAALGQQQVASLWPKKILDDVIKIRMEAEKLALPCELDGKPGDERAHYYTRFAAEKTDPRRRLVEDLLFVGQQNAPKQYEKVVRETDDLYAWTGRVMTDASVAFRVRDDVFAEGPYLAEWLCDPLSADVPDRDKLVSTKLVPLFHRAHELSETINNIQKLHNADYLPPGANLPFRTQSVGVQNDLAAIQTKYDASLKKLAEHEAGEAAEWRQVEAALRTPLIPAATRDSLLKKRAKLAVNLHKEFFEAEHEAKEERNGKEKESDVLNGEHEPTDRYLETVRRWKVHPLFEILQVAAPDDEQALNWSDKANAAARHGLNRQATAQSENKKSAEPGDVDKIASARSRLSAAESELRAKAALINEPAEGKTEEGGPIEDLRRFDIQQLLIWNGRRAIDEFWQNTVKSDSPHPFFARAATGYFQAAKGLSEPPISAVVEQIERGEHLLPAKTERLPIAATARLAPEDEKAAVVSLVIEDDSNALRFPKGYAPVFLRDESRRLVDLPLRPEPPGRAPYVDVSEISGKAQRFDVNIADTSGYASALQAVAFFRGRESATGFSLPVTNGIRVEYVPHVYKDQLITLVGDRLQRSSIEFILDCSQSMDQQTAIKGEVKSDTAERLSLAKDQLKTMLDELVARNQQNEEIHVGVRFFGHRVGWLNGIANGTMLVQDDYQKQAAYLKQLGPSRDIEVALTIGKFDDTVNEGIKKRISALKPYGETPLYLALKEALADFRTEGPDSRKCIIAITDGKNVQTNPDTFARNVLDVWQNHQVPIYILGFDIAPGEAEVASREYTELATATGGKYLPVNNGNELLNTLRQTLPIDLYTVSDSGHPPIKLNESTPIESSKLPKDFTVSFRSINKSVYLEGGEAIELHMSDNGQDIVAKPYKAGLEQANLRGTSTRRPVLLRVHRPERSKAKDSVVFPISLQVDPKAHHFTGRPLETWVEITPLADSVTAGQPYLFYDVNFEPHEPVPVLKWTALNWPKDANRARIRFWCKYGKTAAAQTIALRTLLNGKQSVAGVEFSAKSSDDGNRYSIRIEERHGPQSPGIDDLRVGLETELSYKPLRVIHQFDAQRGVATHSYYFPADLRENIERPEMARVVVTRGKDIKDGALQLPPDGLVVPISAAGELFSPSATINGR